MRIKPDKDKKQIILPGFIMRAANFKKITALAVVFCFVLTNHTSGFAQPAPDANIPAGQLSSEKFPTDILQLQIPEGMGKIEEFYQGAGNRAVILVQDAHAIPEAQKSIQRLIDHFQKHYDLGFVAIEGAPVEQMDVTLLKNFPDSKILKKVFKQYLMNGELTATTAAALFNTEQTPYYGVEDWQVYQKGLVRFLHAVEKMPVISARLERWNKALESRKKQVYSANLLEADRAVQKFRQDSLDLIGLLKVLSKFQAPPEDSELALILNQAAAGGDHEIVLQREVKEFAGKIKRRLENMPKNALKDEIQKTFNARFQAFQTSTLSAQEFASYLDETAKSTGLRFQMSGTLSSSVQTQRDLSEIEGTRFFRALENYIHQVKENLFSKPGERELDRLTEQFALYERLARLKIDHVDWNKIKQEGLVIDDQNAFDDFQPALAFYENAEQRDRTLFEKMIERMDLEGRKKTERKTNSALLVAGGFHAEGITRYLQNRNISYMVIMPEVKNLPEENHYLDQMQGGVSWKNYLTVKNGQMDLYAAFVRGTRDRLLSEAGDQAGYILKAWRDNVIRYLSKEGRVADASGYTRFLDEASVEKASETRLKNEWLANVDRFIAGLKELNQQDKLTQQNVFELFRPASLGTGLTYAGQFSRAQFDLFTLTSERKLRPVDSPDQSRPRFDFSRPEVSLAELTGLDTQAAVPAQTGAAASSAAAGTEKKSEMRAAQNETDERVSSRELYTAEGWKQGKIKQQALEKFLGYERPFQILDNDNILIYLPDDLTAYEIKRNRLDPRDYGALITAMDNALDPYVPYEFDLNAERKFENNLVYAALGTFILWVALMVNILMPQWGGAGGLVNTALNIIFTGVITAGLIFTFSSPQAFFRYLKRSWQNRAPARRARAIQTLTDFVARQRGEMRAEAIDPQTLINPKMKEAFTQLNQGQTPKTINLTLTTEQFGDVFEQFGDQLEALTDEEYIFVTVNFDRSRAERGEKRFSYYVLADQVKNFKDYTIQVLNGGFNLETFQFVFSTNIFPSEQLIHLDEISLAKAMTDQSTDQQKVNQQLLGKGIASEFFSGFSAAIERIYPGFSVTAVAVEESTDSEGNNFHVIPHWLRTRFDAGKSSMDDIRRLKALGVGIDGFDVASVYIGTVRRTELRELPEEVINAVIADLEEMAEQIGRSQVLAVLQILQTTADKGIDEAMDAIGRAAAIISRQRLSTEQEEALLAEMIVYFGGRPVAAEESLQDSSVEYVSASDRAWQRFIESLNDAEYAVLKEGLQYLEDLSVDEIKGYVRKINEVRGYLSHEADKAELYEGLGRYREVFFREIDWRLKREEEARMQVLVERYGDVILGIQRYLDGNFDRSDTAILQIVNLALSQLRSEDGSEYLYQTPIMIPEAVGQMRSEGVRINLLDARVWKDILGLYLRSQVNDDEFAAVVEAAHFYLSSSALPFHSSAARSTEEHTALAELERSNEARVKAAKKIVKDARQHMMAPIRSQFEGEVEFIYGDFFRVQDTFYQIVSYESGKGLWVLAFRAGNSYDSPKPELIRVKREGLISEEGILVSRNHPNAVLRIRNGKLYLRNTDASTGVFISRNVRSENRQVEDALADPPESNAGRRAEIRGQEMDTALRQQLDQLFNVKKNEREEQRQQVGERINLTTREIAGFVFGELGLPEELKDSLIDAVHVSPYVSAAGFLDQSGAAADFIHINISGLTDDDFISERGTRRVYGTLAHEGAHLPLNRISPRADPSVHEVYAYLGDYIFETRLAGTSYAEWLDRIRLEGAAGRLTRKYLAENALKTFNQYFAAHPDAQAFAGKKLNTSEEKQRFRDMVKKVEDEYRDYTRAYKKGLVEYLKEKLRETEEVKSLPSLLQKIHIRNVIDHVINDFSLVRGGQEQFYDHAGAHVVAFGLLSDLLNITLINGDMDRLIPLLIRALQELPPEVFKSIDDFKRHIIRLAYEEEEKKAAGVKVFWAFISDLFTAPIRFFKQFKRSRQAAKLRAEITNNVLQGIAEPFIEPEEDDSAVSGDMLQSAENTRVEPQALLSAAAQGPDFGKLTSAAGINVNFINEKRPAADYSQLIKLLEFTPEMKRKFLKASIIRDGWADTEGFFLTRLAVLAERYLHYAFAAAGYDTFYRWLSDFFSWLRRPLRNIAGTIRYIIRSRNIEARINRVQSSFRRGDLKDLVPQAGEEIERFLSDLGSSEAAERFTADWQAGRFQFVSGIKSFPGYTGNNGVFLFTLPETGQEDAFYEVLAYQVAAYYYDLDAGFYRVFARAFSQWRADREQGIEEPDIAVVRKALFEKTAASQRTFAAQKINAEDFLLNDIRMQPMPERSFFRKSQAAGRYGTVRSEIRKVLSVIAAAVMDFTGIKTRSPFEKMVTAKISADDLLFMTRDRLREQGLRLGAQGLTLGRAAMDVFAAAIQPVLRRRVGSEIFDRYLENGDDPESVIADNVDTILEKSMSPNVQESFETHVLRGSDVWLAPLENHLDNLIAEKVQNQDFVLRVKDIGASFGGNTLSIADILYERLSVYAAKYADGLGLTADGQIDNWIRQQWRVQIDAYDIRLESLAALKQIAGKLAPSKARGELYQSWIRPVYLDLLEPGDRGILHDDGIGADVVFVTNVVTLSDQLQEFSAFLKGQVFNPRYKGFLIRTPQVDQYEYEVIDRSEMRRSTSEEPQNEFKRRRSKVFPIITSIGVGVAVTTAIITLLPRTDNKPAAASVQKSDLTLDAEAAVSSEFQKAYRLLDRGSTRFNFTTLTYEQLLEWTNTAVNHKGTFWISDAQDDIAFMGQLPDHEFPAFRRMEDSIPNRLLNEADEVTRTVKRAFKDSLAEYADYRPFSQDSEYLKFLFGLADLPADDPFFKRFSQPKDLLEIILSVEDTENFIRTLPQDLQDRILQRNLPEEILEMEPVKSELRNDLRINTGVSAASNRKVEPVLAAQNPPSFKQPHADPKKPPGNKSAAQPKAADSLSISKTYQFYAGLVREGMVADGEGLVLYFPSDHRIADGRGDSYAVDMSDASVLGRALAATPEGSLDHIVTHRLTEEVIKLAVKKLKPADADGRQGVLIFAPENLEIYSYEKSMLEQNGFVVAGVENEENLPDIYANGFSVPYVVFIHSELRNQTETGSLPAIGKSELRISVALAPKVILPGEILMQAAGELTEELRAETNSEAIDRLSDAIYFLVNLSFDTDAAQQVLRREMQKLDQTLLNINTSGYGLGVFLPDSANDVSPTFAGSFTATLSGRRGIVDTAPISGGKGLGKIVSVLQEALRQSGIIPRVEDHERPALITNIVQKLMVSVAAGKIEIAGLHPSRYLVHADMEGVEDSSVAAYVEKLETVAAVHIVDLTANNQNLLRADGSVDPVALKQELFKRLLLEDSEFGNLFEMNANGHAAKVLGTVARVYLAWQVAEAAARAA